MVVVLDGSKFKILLAVLDRLSLEDLKLYAALNACLLSEIGEVVTKGDDSLDICFMASNKADGEMSARTEEISKRVRDITMSVIQSMN